MDTDLSKADASFWGEDAIDLSGASVSGAGDVNRDGFDDILIGAFGDDDGGSSAGQTYLILGKASGWIQDTDLSTADASFWGEDAEDASGHSVSGAGDVNGDGFDDILIGATGDDDGGIYAGQTYLILGKASGWAMDTDLSTADASFWGEDAWDWTGHSVSGAGDVNGDGYDDILISARFDSDGGPDRGQTYLIMGKASGWAMDTDLSTADASFWAEGDLDHSGDSVSGAGDVNGDGYDDILIGAPGSDDGGSNAGETYLILGRASGWAMDTNLSTANASFLGEGVDDLSGVWVSGAGDVNGDGYDDILIGAYHNDDGGSNAGQTYLIMGKASGWAMDTSLSTADASFLGEDANDCSGISISDAGDVNGDGYDDIIIGAFWEDDGGSKAGQTYLILGKASGWALDTDLSTADASFWGEDGNDESGYRISGAGDVNGDGYDDILIGALRDDDGGSQAGQTYLLFYEIKPRPPHDLDYRLSKDGNEIEISWDFTGFWDNISIFELYKSEDGINYYLHGITNSTTFNFFDKDISLYKTYHYKLKIIAFPRLESDYSFILEAFNDKDFDEDNIGDIMDQDDDGDGIFDVADMFPHNSTEWLDTDLDGIGNNADDDDDNDGLNDTLDAEPLNPVNTLNYLLNEMNSSILQNQQDIIQYLVKMDLNISSLSVEVDELQLKIQELYQDIQENINSSRYEIISEIANMKNDLMAYIISINILLENVNSSIQKNHENIVNILDSTKQLLVENIEEIKQSFITHITQLEINISSDLDDILSMVESINETTLPEISELLEDLSEQVEENDTELKNKLISLGQLVANSKDEIQTELSNITELIATRTQLENLSDQVAKSDVELQEIMNEVDEKASKTEEQGGIHFILLIIIIFLIIVVIILSLYIIISRIPKSNISSPIEEKIVTPPPSNLPDEVIGEGSGEELSEGSPGPSPPEYPPNSPQNDPLTP